VFPLVPISLKKKATSYLLARQSRNLVNCQTLGFLLVRENFQEAYLNYYVLNRGGFMGSIPKVIGVVSCSIVVCLGLANAAQAERMKADPCADRKTGMHENVNCNKDAREGIDTIKGEVLLVEGGNYLIQRSDGKEVRLFTDETTQVTPRIGRGDWIEAKTQEVDDQKRVMSIRKIDK
jgi:hypothetical protein